MAENGKGGASVWRHALPIFLSLTSGSLASFVYSIWVIGGTMAAHEERIKVNTQDIANHRTEVAQQLRELRAEIKVISDALQRTDGDLGKRIDTLDQHGSRELAASIASLQRLTVVVDKNSEHQGALDSRVIALENRLAFQIQVQIEAIAAATKRIEERTDRLVQALDTTYNTLQTYIRENPSRFNPPKIEQSPPRPP